MTDEQRQQLRDRIGLRVVALRKMRGWSQQELADRAGLQRTHVGRIEAGKYTVTLETIQAIAEALDMTVDIVDERLINLAPLKKITPPVKGWLGEKLNKKVTEVFTVKDINKE